MDERMESLLRSMAKVIKMPEAEFRDNLEAFLRTTPANGARECVFCGNNVPDILMELKRVPEAPERPGQKREKYVVCPNCLISLVMLCLTPEQYRRAIDAGCDANWFYLHDDFYDPETGEALQPKV